MKRPKELTIEDIRKNPDYVNLTDGEAQELLEAIQAFAQIIFENIKLGKYI